METKIVESDGLKWLNRGPDTDDHLSFTGHEMALTPVVQSLADPTAWYVNVGAHVGTWSLRMADRASRVYAIEANPKTFEALEFNIYKNQLQGKVIPISAAIWDEDDAKVKFIDEKGMASGGSTRVEYSSEGLLTTKLDTLFPVGTSTDQRIGFIQMDVEGAEAKVLDGAHNILKFDRPNLLIELHEGHPGTDEDLRTKVYKLLEKHNYTYYPVHVAGDEEHLICRPVETADEYVPEIIEGVTE